MLPPPTKDKSVLGNLPEEQQLQIIRWLSEGPREEREYFPVRDRIESEFGVKVSKTAVGDFYNKFVRPIRLRAAVDGAAALTKVIVGGGDILRDAAILQCQQKAFEILATENPDPDEVRAFLGLTLDAQKIALKREDLALQRDKFKAAIAKKIDLGLEELYEEIKGNKEAATLFERMKACVRKGVETA